MSELYRPLPIELTPGIRSLHERLGPREKREVNGQVCNTAKHELQHAIAANFQIIELSVIPEGTSLGHTKLLSLPSEQFSVAAAAGSIGSGAHGFYDDFDKINQVGVLTISEARNRAQSLVAQYHPTHLDRAAEMIAVLRVATREDVLAVLELARHELETENIDITQFPENYLADSIDLYMLFGEDIRNAKSIEYKTGRYIIITIDGQKIEKSYCEECHQTNGHTPFCFHVIATQSGSSEK